MSESLTAGFPLYEKLVELPHQELEIVSVLTQFKGHVKKELVNVPSIPSYLRGLFYVLDEGKYSSDDSSRIVTLAHSSLCYLVKRVAMQCPSFLEDNETVTELIIHLFLLGSHGSVHLEGRNFWISSTRALEAIELIEPLKVQDCILELLKDASLQRRKILLIMDEVLQISEKVQNSNIRQEIWRNFISALLDLLNNADNNNNDNLDPLACDIILKNERDKTQLRHWISLLNKKNHRDLLAASLDQSSRPSTSSETIPSVSSASLDIDAEMQNIFQEFQIFANHYSNDNVVSVYELSHNTLEAVQSLAEALLIPFQQPKETEKNWKLRQENLIQLRKLLRNEFINKQHPVEFLGICKDLQLIECVGKAALSLRTTLSTTACLVIKDFLQILSSKLDSAILDQMFEFLRTLLSSAKKIASTNAFNCLVIMFSYIDFHNKLFQNCFMLVNQKSVLPKNCSAILLRIFIIKFHHTSKLENSMVYIEEWLKKGITDAQTSVRESMRKTFWYYYKCYPIPGKKFLQSQLSSQLRKAVELSIPEKLEIDYQVSSSFPSSRRTSLGPRKFPSYAKPTQSSNSASGSFLQRAANARSTSENVLRENNVNVTANDTPNDRRKTSAPPQLAKRSLTTIDPQEDHHHRHHHHHPGPLHRAETTDNSLQIDLTGDVTPSHSSSLIKKHIGYELGDGKRDLETMYQYLESPSTLKIKDGLQILQNNLLMDFSSTGNNKNDEGKTLDFDRLSPLIRNVMIRLPQELKPLLSISKFWQSIPLRYLIELYAINHLTFSDELLSYFPPDTLLWTIFETLESLDSSVVDQENEMPPSLSLHYMKYKQFIFNFCFRLVNQVLHESNVDSILLKDFLGQCILKLAQICGQEYDETLYFDTLHQIYQYDRILFVEKIRQVTYVSTKLKICDQLESRDKDKIFRREAIVSRQSLDGMERHQLFEGEPRDNEILDDRRVMEMTMVNPFNQMRTASGGSVVHHDPRIPEFAAHTGHDDEKPESDHHIEPIEEEDQKRLSEITKVVSIYQPVDREDDDGSQNRNIFKSDQDVEMLDVPQEGEPNVNLSDIFGNSQDREVTVKFSKDPPKIINSSRVPSSSVENTRDDDVRTLTRNVSMERDKSPVTPLTDHQSVELSNAINSIELGKKHEISLSHEAKVGSNLSAEILANAIRERENDSDDRKTSEFDLLEAVPSDSLIYHEISHAMLVTHEFEDIGQMLSQMKKAITRIESRSFTMKHLNILIAPLISCLHEESLRNWLESENGYYELLQLGKTLFHSTDETEMVPVNLACKSIVLIECLVLVNNYLHDVVPISSSEFKTIWADALALINKLPEYSSEIYCLLQELRDLLVFLNFFDTKDITSMLHALITEVQEGSSGIKETFLMETLAIIVSKAQTALRSTQILEIVQVMQLYVESKRADWRLACCEVLSQISQHLSIMPDKHPIDIQHSLEALSHGRQRVIQALSSH
ncbi:hypothetical protein ZYGR_0AD03100 [Zygosaccharomyces rouxii]|uniref:Protein STU1 n=2 Tax=Zygosaccharomyces rouxii TaxID=4956 RepID=C5E0J2_ZYGRC|nr:uncharacterized protein ZYRO0G13178g [Zygosaccharomyces rouxii]KAH9202619.1 clasp N terminal-domain-containing protein [Zygosaccharomyces rouxii]GAV51127.1 hypothetical protein ZYGR_0AD03100 [Zygosaccharomyces rouxii]CAR29626.1 ZYRO0G13178p [Zygosaccharomyces rouxii]